MPFLNKWMQCIILYVSDKLKMKGFLFREGTTPRRSWGCWDVPVRRLPRRRHHRPHQHAHRHDEPLLRGYSGTHLMLNEFPFTGKLWIRNEVIFHIMDLSPSCNFCTEFSSKCCIVQDEFPTFEVEVAFILILKVSLSRSLYSRVFFLQGTFLNISLLISLSFHSIGSKNYLASISSYCTRILTITLCRFTADRVTGK